jgi:FixJ family two-component response regulator
MLTPRQYEVAQLVAQGKSNKAIARITGLSVHTVEHHISEAAIRIPGDGPPRRRIMLHIIHQQYQAA